MKVDMANKRVGKLRFLKNSKFVRKVIVIALCVLLFSCGGKTKPGAAMTEGEALPVSAAGEDAASLKLPTQLWHFSDEAVCIFFGYGYNDAAFVASISASISLIVRFTSAITISP